LDESPYFGNYDRWNVPWQLTVGEVDGEPAVIILGRTPSGWIPKSFVRLEVADQQIIRVLDLLHCPWILPAASSVVVADSPEYYA
jgi:RNA polymerase sigma-70 factor (ECF subfamily)